MGVWCVVGSPPLTAQGARFPGGGLAALPALSHVPRWPVVAAGVEPALDKAVRSPPLAGSWGPAGPSPEARLPGTAGQLRPASVGRHTQTGCLQTGCGCAAAGSGATRPGQGACCTLAPWLASLPHTGCPACPTPPPLPTCGLGLTSLLGSTQVLEDPLGCPVLKNWGAPPGVSNPVTKW